MSVPHQQAGETSGRITAGQSPRKLVCGDLVRTTFVYAALVVCAMLFLIPFYIVVRNALMVQTEITSFDWHWWAQIPQWGNLNTLFNDLVAPMGTGLINSTIIATLTTGGQLLFASMAGYALARI